MIWLHILKGSRAALGERKEASGKAMAIIHSRDGRGLDEGVAVEVVRNGEIKDLFFFYSFLKLFLFFYSFIGL